MLVAGWHFAMRAGLRIVVTPSLPLGVYQIHVGAPTRGDLVLACLPEPVARFALGRGYLWEGSCPGGDVPLAKMMAAVAGDTVTVTSAGLAINGRSVPNSLPRDRDSMGRPLSSQPRGAYLVRNSEVWLAAPYHPLSFDSRYFGPVPAAGVVARLDPLWTW